MPKPVNGRPVNLPGDYPFSEREETNIEEIYNFLPDYGDLLTNRHHHNRLYDNGDNKCSLYCIRQDFIKITPNGNVQVQSSNDGAILEVEQANSSLSKDELIPLELIQEDVSESIIEFETNSIGGGDFTWSVDHTGNAIVGGLKVRAGNDTDGWDNYRIRIYENET